MKYLSLKLKIILIFIIPAIALAYFSITFTIEKYQKLNESSMHKFSTEVTSSLSRLIHEVQIERGLSAGYIVATNEKLKNKLISQYKLTDKAFKNLKFYILLKSDNKSALKAFIGYQNEPLIKKVLSLFNKLQKVRDQVLSSSINLNDEITFYSTINEKLINAIRTITNLLKKQTDIDIALIKLQSLKENAGLERAYIFHQLLSRNYNKQSIEKIRRVQLNQKNLKEQFILFGSMKSNMIYHKHINLDIEEKVAKFRNNFLEQTINSKNAQEWFDISTKRINMIGKISNLMLNKYTTEVQSIYSYSLNSLYITAILLVLSLTSLVVLIYIIRTLMNTEEQNMEDLRIASYTFDSHEAMTITDVNGIILRVNKAFTTITGYDASEVIGKNPRVLKSMRHPDEFYKDMWNQLHTQGKWSDDIYNKRKNGEIYPERLSITAIKDINDITTHYIAQFLDISDIQKAKESAQHQADHDFLTGILNRKALMQRLNEEFKKGRRHDFLHAFLFIDLDAFKDVNDNYGHDIGDQALIEVTIKIQSVLREEDVCARIGGDEFAVLILNIDKSDKKAAQDVKTICQKIIDKVSLPFMCDEHKINIGASIGVKLFPDNEKTSHDVMLHADAAMYQAKDQGKNKFVFFDKTLEFELKEFALLEEELNYALHNDEFDFYYQPKVDTMSNKINGAELLIRWNHPHKGLLYPDSFLKVASEIGLMPKITNLALNKACGFLKTNKEIFKHTLSINVDSNELLNQDFKTNLIFAIKKYKIDPSQIELEITERELIDDFIIANEKINELRNYGIKFSIDDFGTEYSSITYIQKLSVDTLKVDKSFLNNLTKSSDKKLLNMIIKMSKIFNMEIVVEGVEKKSQFEFIKKCKADTYQGHYFSKAIKEKEFLELLKS